GPTLKDDRAADTLREEESAVQASTLAAPPPAAQQSFSHPRAVGVGWDEELFRPRPSQGLAPSTLLPQAAREDTRGGPDSHGRGTFLPVPPGLGPPLKEPASFPDLSRGRVFPNLVV